MVNFKNDGLLKEARPLPKPLLKDECAVAARTYRAWWAEYLRAGTTELETHLHSQSEKAWAALTLDQYRLALEYLGQGG